MVRRQLVTSLLMTVALTVLLGLLYPLAVFAVGQGLFKDNAQGSLVRDANGNVVGSSLLGQLFVDADGKPVDEYFQPRPSAAGADGYDPQASGGSNLGPANQKLLDAVAQRVSDYRTLNGLGDDALVPVDAVTASGSGLDPSISIANADLQIARVARARGISSDVVERLVRDHTTDRALGFLGEASVNVLELNLALDGL